MSRLEQMGKMRERLVKKRDEVFEAHRLSEEERLILSEHDIEPEETAQKAAIADVVATLDEREEKEIQAINRALTRWNLGNTAPARSVEKKSRWSALRQFPGHLSAANMQAALVFVPHLPMPCLSRCRRRLSKTPLLEV